jgi:hypothetical protein
MTEQTCKNCGGWYGLHHYETNQCPKNGRETNPQMWESTTYQEEDKEDNNMADLEAANILLNNTINVQLQVIREHQAADVIAVEAIRAQAEEIKQLKAAIKELELDDDYGYAEQKNFD